MLFLVLSTPRRSKITAELVAARLGFRRWIKSLNEQVVCFYPRKDRGAVVIFNLPTRRHLDLLLRTWKKFVLAKLEVYPLQEPAIAERNLRTILKRISERKK